MTARFKRCFQAATVGLVGLATFTSTTSAALADGSVNSTSTNRVASVAATDRSMFSGSEKKAIVDQYVSYGSSEAKAKQLISSLETGRLWDSLTPGKKPLESVKREIGDVIEVIDTYADGSISVRSISNTKLIRDRTVADETRGEVQPKSVSGCAFKQAGNYAAYWKNCTALVNVIIGQMGFTFDYEYMNGRPAEITAYRNYFHYAFGVSLDNFRFDKISSSQVRLSADLSVAFKGAPLGWTAWVQANVHGVDAWTTNN